LPVFNITGKNLLRLLKYMTCLRSINILTI